MIAPLLVAALLQAPPPRTTFVTVHAGIPAPIAVYGFKASGGSVEQRYPVAFGLRAAARVAADWPAWWAVHAETARILAVDGDAEARTYFTTFGPLVLWAPWTWRADPLSGPLFGLGPDLLFSGIVVDESLRLDTWTLGGRAEVQAGLPLGDAWALHAGASLGAYLPPMDRETWFNVRLGRTILAVATLGATWAE